MNVQNLNKQRGLTLISLIFVCALVIMAGLVGIKVAPEVIEYYAILKNVKATATEPANKTASVAQIRTYYDRRKQIDNISAVTGADLDISKEGNDVVIAFAYTRKIHLFGPVSLTIDFEGNTAQ